MKRLTQTICITICLLTLVVGATAQTQQINFADLPLLAAPTPMPLGYGGMNWANFWYVDPALWPGAGPGYQNLLTHKDVAFIGGQFCGQVSLGCYGVINFLGSSFVPVGAVMAAGFQANRITVLAYNNGNFVGSVSYNLTITPQVVKFPTSWGAITEMQVQTDEAGDLVLSDLSIHPMI